MDSGSESEKEFVVAADLIFQNRPGQRELCFELNRQYDSGRVLSESILHWMEFDDHASKRGSIKSDDESTAEYQIDQNSCWEYLIGLFELARTHMGWTIVTTQEEQFE